jgi:anti-sigma factor RsiW
VDEITCRELVELVTAYLDDALDEPTLNHVEEHLVMCEWCVTYVEQMQGTVRALGELPSEPAPERVRQAVAGALRERKGRAD